jgi:pimeloyl-ACP methyl ester carboxylesterase
VRALIIEDIGAEVNDDLSFAKSIIDTAPTLEDLSENLKNFGINDSRYFLESAFETGNGWHFRFDKNNLPISQESLNGVWWDDFLATDCQAILLHGRHSHVVNIEQIERMADKRINTTYQVFEDSGHAIHYDEPKQFIKIVSDFLDKL